MNEVFDELQRSLAEGQPVVLATVAATRGSTPRRAGARMLVRTDGSFCGTIGGGCGEAEVWSEAMEAHRDGRAFSRRRPAHLNPRADAHCDA